MSSLDNSQRAYINLDSPSKSNENIVEGYLTNHIYVENQDPDYTQNKGLCKLNLNNDKLIFNV